MPQYYHSDLHLALSSLTKTGYTTRDTDGWLTLALTFEVDPAILRSLLDEKTEYLQAVDDTTVTREQVCDAVADDLAAGLNIMFNTVGGPGQPETGVYKQINDRQWEQTAADIQYSAYQDLLWELTDEAQPEGLSIPSLYGPFLEAAAESDDHDVPPQGTVRPILKAHIDDVRATNKSREAVRQLKSDLEAQGIDPRTAARVASNLDEAGYLRRDTELDDT